MKGNSVDPLAAAAAKVGRTIQRGQVRREISDKAVDTTRPGACRLRSSAAACGDAVRAWKVGGTRIPGNIYMLVNGIEADGVRPVIAAAPQVRHLQKARQVGRQARDERIVVAGVREMRGLRAGCATQGDRRARQVRGVR